MLLFLCDQLAVFHCDQDRVTHLYLICQDQLCRQRFHIFLDITLQRTRAINRIICVVYNELLRIRAEFDRKLLIFQTMIQVCDNQIDNTADVILRQRLEQDDLIQTVQKLRTEVTCLLYTSPSPRDS